MIFMFSSIPGAMENANIKKFGTNNFVIRLISLFFVKKKNLNSLSIFPVFFLNYVYMMLQHRQKWKTNVQVSGQTSCFIQF